MKKRKVKVHEDERASDTFDCYRTMVVLKVQQLTTSE